MYNKCNHSISAVAAPFTLNHHHLNHNIIHRSQTQLSYNDFLSIQQQESQQQNQLQENIERSQPHSNDLTSITVASPNLIPNIVQVKSLVSKSKQLAGTSAASGPSITGSGGSGGFGSGRRQHLVSRGAEFLPHNSPKVNVGSIKHNQQRNRYYWFLFDYIFI